MIIKLWNGNVVGQFDPETYTFYKVVKGSGHRLRSPEGWSIDSGIVANLEGWNCETVVIKDKETDEIFTVAFDTFKQYGIEIERGYGKQVVLPIKFWKVENGNREAVRRVV